MTLLLLGAGGEYTGPVTLDGVALEDARAVVLQDGQPVGVYRDERDDQGAVVEREGAVHWELHEGAVTYRLTHRETGEALAFP